jgi:hypothetical protein
MIMYHQIVIMMYPYCMLHTCDDCQIQDIISHKLCMENAAV